MIGWNRERNQVSVRIGPFVWWCEARFWPRRSSLGRSIGGNLSLWFAPLHITIAGKALLEREYPAHPEVDRWLRDAEARHAATRHRFVGSIGEWQSIARHLSAAESWAWFRGMVAGYRRQMPARYQLEAQERT